MSGLRFYHRLIRDLILPNNAGASDPRLVLGPDIPALLLAQYAPNTVIACELAYGQGGQNYEYTAWLEIASTGETITIRGHVYNNTIYEWMMNYFDPASGVPRATNVGNIFSPAASTGYGWTFNDIAAPIDPTNALYSFVDIGTGVDFLVDHISQGRGILDFVSATAASGNFTAETTVLTSNGVTWAALRAYEVIVNCDIIGVAGTGGANLILRKTNSGGTLLAITPMPITSTAIATHTHWRIIVRNNTTSDVTANVVFDLQSTTANTIRAVGSASSLRYMEIRDIGESARYTSAVQI